MKEQGEKLLKYFLILVVLIAASTVGHVRASSLSVDPANSVAIQGFAPDPNAAVSVKGPSSQLFDLKGKIAWEFINTGPNCFARILPSKNKGNIPKFPYFSFTDKTYVVHRNAVFLNLSGCTGILLMQ